MLQIDWNALERLRTNRIFMFAMWLLICSVVMNPTAIAQSDANPAAGTEVVIPPASDQPTRTEASLMEIIFSGGPVGIGIMIGLIALSLIATYLVFEQIMTLRRNEIMPEGLGEEVRQLLAAGRWKEAEQACKNRPSPLSFVLVSGLGEVEYGWGAVEKALEEATADQAARLYRKIEYLSVIGNLAPMMGLLGTVTGMILAFRQVANSQGTAGAADLAEGIYSALVTTVAGLLIAIPALGAFAMFRNRVDQLIAECAYLTQHIFSPVRRRTVATATRPVTPSPPPRS